MIRRFLNGYHVQGNGFMKLRLSSYNNLINLFDYFYVIAKFYEVHMRYTYTYIN